MLLARTFSCILLIVIISGCTTVKFVQPYDDSLITGIQEFYKSTAKFVENGKQVSPPTRPDSEDLSNKGHLSHYQDGYSNLVIEVNNLIIRSMVNSVKVDELGKSMQDKVEQLIDESIPSVCAGTQARLGKEFTSLTVKNFADLKCLVSRWKVQHENAPSKTLTSGDWQRRHTTLMNVVIEIQRAESFKQVEKDL